MVCSYNVHNFFCKNTPINSFSLCLLHSIMNALNGFFPLSISRFVESFGKIKLKKKTLRVLCKYLIVIGKKLFFGIQDTYSMKQNLSAKRTLAKNTKQNSDI